MYGLEPTPVEGEGGLGGGALPACRHSGFGCCCCCEDYWDCCDCCKAWLTAALTIAFTAGFR